MPLKLTVPDKDGHDTVRIEGYTVDSINDPNNIRVSIVYGRGTTVDNVYTEKSGRRRVDFLAGSILSKMVAPLSPKDTIFGAVKVALYDLLQEGRHVGPGKVT